MAALISAGAVAGSAINSFLESPHQSFHFTNEGFFGRTTYAGGADKAAHVVDYAIVSKELAYAYGLLGFSRTESIWMGFAVASFAGFVTEITEDLFGLRGGVLLPPSGAAICCQVKGKGRDASPDGPTSTSGRYGTCSSR